jgi:hypothetical protein
LQTRKRLKRNLQAKRSKLERKAWRVRRDKTRLHLPDIATLSCASACHRGYLRPFGRTHGAVFAGGWHLVLRRRLPPAKAQCAFAGCRLRPPQAAAGTFVAGKNAPKTPRRFNNFFQLGIAGGVYIYVDRH